MISSSSKRLPSAHHGLFLFFVVGLFMLQIAFAFTIHGDIGPQSPMVPGIDRPASPLLVGRIDSLLSGGAVVKKPVRPQPEAALAPAVKAPLNEVTVTAQPAAPEVTNSERSGTKVQAGSSVVAPKLRKNGRYFEYTVESGDTLAGISTKLYGNARMVQAIVRLNRIRDEKSLRLGGKLLVPESGMLEKLASR